MALNLAALKNLPSQLGATIEDLFQNIQSKISGKKNKSDHSALAAGYRQLTLQIVAFIVFALLSFWVINQVRVNGPISNILNEYQNLTADTNPPPMFPLDAFASYNEAYVASTNFNNEKRDRALANAAKSEALFKERSEYWRKNLDNEKLQASLENVIQAGSNFFEVANKRYIPALPLGTVAASAPLLDLTAAFEQSKQAGNTFTQEIQNENKIEGFKIERINKDSAFAKLGLKEGDIIKSVNNSVLESYADAFKVYNNMENTKYLNMEILRNNEIVELNYEID